VTRYTADSRDRILDAVDMIALISTRTDLRRAGVNSYFGICPFHDERTGSFHVSPEEKLYHCFGCQVSGNPFDFVMQTEGLDFKGALESLADRFGVKLETEAEDPAAATRRERRERLHRLLGRAASYYSLYLWDAREAQDARGYLLGRGLEEQTLRAFRVGYAPSAWDRILTASRSAGYSDEELLAVGLAQRSKTRPGQVYDRFRERIMFPAVDARGRVNGFGARRMRENQGGAKYLNTSDGELYHKREVLFGIDLARASAAHSGRMILVEGYTDVLALHQAGLQNAVGIMGTALTEEQVRELERIVGVLELCLDADRAGQDAILRASRLAACKLELRVVPLPEGTDPAELVQREGPGALRERVQGSVPFAAFNVDRILERSDTGSAEGKDRALAELAPVLDELAPSVLRDELMRRVAGRLELAEGRLVALLAGDLAPAPPRDHKSNGSDSSPPPAAGLRLVDHQTRAERTFLALCIAMPERGARMLAEIDPEALLTSAMLRHAAVHLRGRTASPLADLPPDDEPLARTIAALVELAGRAIDHGPDRLQHVRLLLERDRLSRAIIRARADGASGINELAHERETVLEAIRRVVVQLEQAL
jgi:DNA primase